MASGQNFHPHAEAWLDGERVEEELEVFADGGRGLRLEGSGEALNEELEIVDV